MESSSRDRRCGADPPESPLGRAGASGSGARTIGVSVEAEPVDHAWKKNGNCSCIAEASRCNCEFVCAGVNFA